MQRKIIKNVGQKNDIPMTDLDIKKIMTLLEEALHYLQELNIMHRDIKPDKIMNHIYFLNVALQVMSRLKSLISQTHNARTYFMMKNAIFLAQV